MLVVQKRLREQKQTHVAYFIRGAPVISVALATAAAAYCQLGKTFQLVAFPNAISRLLMSVVPALC